MGEFKMTTVGDEVERTDFAVRAARHFAENPKHWSFGELTPGSFLALRWGFDNNSVLLLKLDEHEVPTVFQNAINSAMEQIASDLDFSGG